MPAEIAYHFTPNPFKVLIAIVAKNASSNNCFIHSLLIFFYTFFSLFLFHKDTRNFPLTIHFINCIAELKFTWFFSFILKTGNRKKHEQDNFQILNTFAKREPQTVTAAKEHKLKATNFGSYAMTNETFNKRCREQKTMENINKKMTRIVATKIKK